MVKSNLILKLKCCLIILVMLLLLFLVDKINLFRFLWVKNVVGKVKISIMMILRIFVVLILIGKNSMLVLIVVLNKFSI